VKGIWARVSKVWLELVVPGVCGDGDAATEGPREDRSGVSGVLTSTATPFCGVTGTGADTGADSSSAASRTILASAILALNTSVLNKQRARSRLGRLINRSDNSPICDFSNLLIAWTIRSRSEVGCNDPEGEEVREGVTADPGMDTGVEGCSGAEAIAALVIGSKRRESCEGTGDGEERDLLARTRSASFVGSCITETTSLRDRLTIESTSGSTSSLRTAPKLLIRLVSSPERTSLRTTGESADKLSY